MENQSGEITVTARQCRHSQKYVKSHLQSGLLRRVTHSSTEDTGYIWLALAKVTVISIYYLYIIYRWK
jgi:hypothetical protein